MKKQKIHGTPTLNGKPIKIIDSWDKMNFSQFLRILKLKDDHIELISILTDIEYEYLKKAEITGLESILYIAQFINTEPKFTTNPIKIGKYKLPLNSKGIFDVQFESLAQFEDMRNVFNSLKEGVYAHTEAYATYCAIYCQKLRDGSYDGDKALAMVPEMMLLPASQIVGPGGFFFLKLRSLSNGIISNSHITTQNQGKSTGKSIKKRLGSRQRSTRSQGR